MPIERVSQPTSPKKGAQRVIVDTIVHTIIVSGDEKEIERLIQDKVEELEREDPDAPIIIKQEV